MTEFKVGDRFKIIENCSVPDCKHCLAEQEVDEIIDVGVYNDEGIFFEFVKIEKIHETWRKTLE